MQERAAFSDGVVGEPLGHFGPALRGLWLSGLAVSPAGISLQVAYCFGCRRSSTAVHWPMDSNDGPFGETNNGERN